MVSGASRQRDELEAALVQVRKASKRFSTRSRQKGDLAGVAVAERVAACNEQQLRRVRSISRHLKAVA